MSHQFLRFVKPPPGRRILRELAVALMNRFFGVKLSRTAWLKVPPRQVSWFEERRDANQARFQVDRLSKPISLGKVELALESGSFSHLDFDLFDPRCDWLDASVHIIPKFHGSPRV